ncbi:uncharacterized protein LOC133783165 [Humulus lupulus]|uniref:uncharacterized protein LOC133783165 n=1 Tax=Humulus lupulus TaxID=3486 RepID=UPI002B408780|nr:uncharacterized protein LOC133783165 [Humulus lupulus]
MARYWYDAKTFELNFDILLPFTDFFSLYMIGSTLFAYLMYNGVWEREGRDWVFNGAENLTFELENDITYSQLVELLYSELEVDKVQCDLKLEVNYKYMKGLMYRPELLRNDKGVSLYLSMLLKKPDEFVPLFVTLVEKNIIVDRNPPPSTVKDTRSEVGTYVPETNPEVLVATAIPESNHFITTVDHVAQMPFHDDFPDCPDPENDFEGNDDQETEVRSQALSLSPLSYQIPRQTTCRSRPRREDRQTPGTSSSRPDGTNDAREFSDPLSSSTYYSKFKAQMFTREDIEDNSHYISMGGTSGGEIHLGKFFRDKELLKKVAGLFAMKKGFDFIVKKSGTDVWYITCKDPDCGWRLRGKKKQLSNMFEVTAFENVHTCSLDVRKKDNRQASPLVVAELIKDKFSVNGSDYLASKIREDMKNSFGIEMSYEKAWRCREKALHIVRGTPEASYSKLPGYLHMLQLNNPDSITDFKVDEGRFKYCFFSLGACRRGFMFCRPVICIDGSFLKTRYGGQMLCAVALDSDNHIFPIAFAMVDSENHDSWTYFMRKLKQAIGDVENLAFVSDRHQSIVHALELVFPDAPHGACYHHIIMNVASKFKTDCFTDHIYSCAYSYKKTDFEREFEKIKAMDVRVALYLEGIGFERWVRAYFPGDRYNVMTSNWAESFNNKTKDARAFPITAFVEFIRFTIQTWFATRKENAEKCSTTLSPVMEGDLSCQFEKSRFLSVDRAGPYTFNVHPGGTVQSGGIVDLEARQCSCGLFQIMKIPCPHACAAAQERNISMYALCSQYYTRESWKSTYEGTIMPVGDEDDWELPEDIKNIQVGVPIEKKPVGRPKKQKVGRIRKNRYPSNGDKVVIQRCCSKCGGKGHNKASCKYRG